MRREILSLAVAFGLCSTACLAYAAEKMAYVDVAEVFDQYKKTKEYDKVLEKEQEEYEKKRDVKVGEVKKLQEELSLLSDKEKESRRSELEDKITQLQEFDRNATQDLRKQRDEKAQEIFKDIKEAIDTYAQKQGLSLVFDKRALAFYDDSLDITDKISKILEKK